MQRYRHKSPRIGTGWGRRTLSLAWELYCLDVASSPSPRSSPARQTEIWNRCRCKNVGLDQTWDRKDSNLFWKSSEQLRTPMLWECLSVRFLDKSFTPLITARHQGRAHCVKQLDALIDTFSVSVPSYRHKISCSWLRSAPYQGSMMMMMVSVLTVLNLKNLYLL